MAAVVLLAACPLFLVAELVGRLATGDEWQLALPAPVPLTMALVVTALLVLWWPTGAPPYVPQLVLLGALATAWLSLMGGADVAAVWAGVVAVTAAGGVVVDRRLRRSGSGGSAA